MRSFTSKVTLKKEKGQHTEWEKIMANSVSDKGVVFKMYKNYYSSTIKKNNLKMGKGF